MTEVGVALLRGINVGGKNKLPMRDLATICEAAGCRDVQTYIQSGNVVFRAEPAVFAQLANRVTAQIHERFGYRVPVVLRTAAQLADTVAGNPFLERGEDVDRLLVLFLADRPAPARLAALDSGRFLPDEFIVLGQEIYLWLPNGAGRSKLTNAYFDTALGTVSTGRNWRTVAKLHEMVSG